MNDLLGIDVGGTHIKMAAFSPEGQMLAQWHRPTGDAPTDGVPAFAQTIREMVREHAAPGAHIGLAAPGVAEPGGRFISHNPGKLHGLEGLNWTAFLEHPTPVRVLNDAHAALLGEVWSGAAKGARDAMLLTLGTGVGGAVLSDGRLLKGVIGRAGHLGHVSISENPELSIFGIPGSLEMMVGNYSVGSRSAGRFSSTRELVEAYEAGDEDATAIWLCSLRHLARALAGYINIIDPAVIIIAGGIATAGDALFTPLRTFLDEVEWQPGGHKVPIIPALLGEWAGAYGAARNAAQVAP